jgi:hypothetical protein
MRHSEQHISTPKAAYGREPDNSDGGDTFDDDFIFDQARSSRHIAGILGHSLCLLCLERSNLSDCWHERKV